MEAEGKVSDPGGKQEQDSRKAAQSIPLFHAVSLLIGCPQDVHVVAVLRDHAYIYIYIYIYM